MYRLIGKEKGISNKEAEYYSLYVLLHLGNSFPNMVFLRPMFVLSYFNTGFGTLLALNQFFFTVNTSILGLFVDFSWPNCV